MISVMQYRCDWERNEYGNKEETGYNAKQTLRTLHSISTLIPSILLLLLVLLRGVVHVDPLVDETPHIGFFICFDEQGIATQRADDKALITQRFLVFLLQIHFGDGVALDNDAFGARQD